MEEKTNYLAHHGVKGMKWGVRHDPKPTGRRSVRGNIHRGLAAVYRLNEKTYNKMGNKTMASMNASARKRQLEKAKTADSKKNAKRQLKMDKIKAKGEAKARKAILRAEAKKTRSSGVKSSIKKAGKTAANVAFDLAIYSMNKKTRENMANRQYVRDRKAAQKKLTPFANERVYTHYVSSDGKVYGTYGSKAYERADQVLNRKR